jgi:hypothetical protein
MSLAGGTALIPLLALVYQPISVLSMKKFVKEKLSYKTDFKMHITMNYQSHCYFLISREKKTFLIKNRQPFRKAPLLLWG